MRVFFISLKSPQPDKKEDKKMKVMLKDGSSKEFAAGVSVLDVAREISEGLARAAMQQK